MRISRRTYILLLILIAACCLMVVTDALARRSAFQQIDMLADIRNLIVRGYVEEPDQDRMIEAAVRGMVESLDDPYSIYLDLDQNEQLDRQVNGSFSGIGAQVEINAGQLRIVSPLEDSPAWKGGVMAGDIVLEIDGVPTTEIFEDLVTRSSKLREAVKRLTGEQGTIVTIRVQHESGEEQLIEIIRARINIQTVKGLRRGADNHWDFMLDHDNRIGYVRLTQFAGKTADQLRDALDQLVEQDVRALVLDLRFNPGGLLDSAIEISDMFLDEGKRIVSVKGRVIPENITKAKAPDKIGNIPMVVLANETSASASEVVTGALNDNGRAKFIGTRTYGKGSVQQVRKLQGDIGALKLTYAYYYLPNGRNIHRKPDAEVWGVDPDDGFYVPMSYDERIKMRSVRREGDVLRRDNSDAAEQATPQWIENELADLQLAAAIRALLGKLETGEWPVVGESGADQIVKLQRREQLNRLRRRFARSLEQAEQELAKLDLAEDELEPVTAQAMLDELHGNVRFEDGVFLITADDLSEPVTEYLTAPYEPNETDDDSESEE